MASPRTQAGAVEGANESELAAAFVAPTAASPQVKAARPGSKVSALKFRSQVARGLPFQWLTEALHRCGPRLCAEVLAEALRRLGPDDRREVLELAERIRAWPPEAIRYLGADRFAPPPLELVT